MGKNMSIESESKKKRGRPRKRDYGVCPRCGRPISWIEYIRKNGREYVIAVHYSGTYIDESGKRKKKIDKCYLGPKEEYEYVSRTHEGLVLKGYNDSNRFIEYLDALIKLVQQMDLDRKTTTLLGMKFKEVSEVLLKYGNEE